jgi:hypothetical protein
VSRLWPPQGGRVGRRREGRGILPRLATPMTTATRRSGPCWRAVPGTDAGQRCAPTKRSCGVLRLRRISDTHGRPYHATRVSWSRPELAAWSRALGSCCRSGWRISAAGGILRSGRSLGQTRHRLDDQVVLGARSRSRPPPC